MFCYILSYLVLFLHICFEYSHYLPCTTAQPIHESEERRCSTSTGRDGVCRRLPSCPAVALAISVGVRQHERCGFIGHVEIVCCSRLSFQETGPPTVPSSQIPLPDTELLSKNEFVSFSLVDSDFVATSEMYKVPFSSTATPDENVRKYNRNNNENILDDVKKRPYNYSSGNSFASEEENIRQEQDIKTFVNNHNDTQVYSTIPSYVTLRNWYFKVFNVTTVSPPSVLSSPHTYRPFTAQNESQGSTYPTPNRTASYNVRNAQHSTTKLEAPSTTMYVFGHSESTATEDNSWFTRGKTVVSEGYIVRPTQLSPEYLPIYPNHTDIQNTNPSYNFSHTLGNVSSNLSNRPTPASSPLQHNDVAHLETLPSNWKVENSSINHPLSTEPTQIRPFQRNWQTTLVLPTKTVFSTNYFPFVPSSSIVTDTTFDSFPVSSENDQFSESSDSTFVTHKVNNSGKSKIREEDLETVHRNIVREGSSKQSKKMVHEDPEIGLRPSLDLQSNEILSFETNLPKIQTTIPAVTKEENNNYNMKDKSSPLPVPLLMKNSRENMKNIHDFHLENITHAYENTIPDELFHTTHTPHNTMIDEIHNSYWSTRESTTQTPFLSEDSWTQTTTEQHDQSLYQPSEKNKTSVTETTTSSLLPDNTEISQSISRSQKACTKYKKTPKLTKYIIGGDYADHGEFPHMVALGFKKPRMANLSWLCGGTLLNEEFVLTAAHCVRSEYGRPLMARVGFTNLSADWITGREVAVLDAVVHPAFDKSARFADVALLRLANPLTLSPFVSPACLRQDATAPPGDLVVTGWGSVTPDGSTPTDHLKKAIVKAVDDDACRMSYPDLFRPQMICAGSEDVVDSCKGDSGGPLQLLEDPSSSVYTVVGVTSFGPNPCAGPRPGVYTRVASFVPWIESIVWGDGAEVTAGPLVGSESALMPSAWKWSYSLSG